MGGSQSPERNRHVTDLCCVIGSLRLGVPGFNIVLNVGVHGYRLGRVVMSPS